MNARARNFISANAISPAVYCSVDGRCVTYRLADGKLFHLNTEEAANAGKPRWEFENHKANERVLVAMRRDELALLERVEAEMRR